MPSLFKPLTKGAILNISANADVYERGKRYFQDGKLVVYTENSNDENLTISAEVEGNYKNYTITITFDLTGNVLGYECSCDANSIWHGACKHIVTVLFGVLEKKDESYTEYKPNEEAGVFTKNLENIIFAGINDTLSIPLITTNTSKLKLMPKLHCIGNKSIHLTFTVGFERQYIIKNLVGFLNAFKTGETISYGTGLAFAHRKDFFNDTSQKLIDFLILENEMYTEMGKRLSRQYHFTYHPLLGSRELHLVKRNIGELFEIYNGSSLECVSEYTNEVKLIDGLPPFSIHVTHDNDLTTINGSYYPYFVMQDNSYYYVLSQDGFFRMKIFYGRIFDSFQSAINNSLSHEIHLIGNDRRSFITVSLPKLREIGIVSHESGEVKVQVTDFTGKMYFDSERQNITCKVEFHYPEVIINAFADESYNAQIVRNAIKEHLIKRSILSLGFDEDAARQVFILKDNELMYDFLNSSVIKEGNARTTSAGIISLMEHAEIYVSSSLKKKASGKASPQIGIRLTGDLLKISLENTDFALSDLYAGLEAYRSGKKYFRLRDGRFIDFDSTSIKSAANLLNLLDVDEKEFADSALSVPACKILYIDNILSEISEAHDLKIEESVQDLIDHFNNVKPLEIKIPRILQKTLREYQSEGFKWLKTLYYYKFGGILADDMGLGKTIQVITLLLSEKQSRPSLVVSPSSLLYNWENEINKFAPGMRVQIISGLPDKRKELLHKKNIDVFITTYDTLKRDIDMYKSFEFNIVIADEAQNIKNPTTQASRALKSVNSGVRFALTGTPIENNLTELWSIFDFIMPGFLYNLTKFSRLYESPIMKYNDKEKALKLRKQIEPFVLRRTKRNVLKELPEKTETILQADLTTEQLLLYQASLLEAVEAFDGMIKNNTFDDNRMQVLATLTRLRQICCHPSLCYENYKSDSGKLNLTLETIQLALESGHRVLLFSQFTSMLEIIKSALDASGIMSINNKKLSYFYLDGRVKSKERMAMTEKFNKGERDLFLISLKAGGTGLNLTGADVVIHFDPWWNPSVMDQASDRAHRYGQKNPVQVFNIVAKNTIEEKIIRLHDKKRNLIDSVIVEGGSFINMLSEEEIRKLFE